MVDFFLNVVIKSDWFSFTYLFIYFLFLSTVCTWETISQNLMSFSCCLELTNDKLGSLTSRFKARQSFKDFDFRSLLEFLTSRKQTNSRQNWSACICKLALGLSS